MRATFANQLVFSEPGQKNSIKYTHPFRVDVDFLIQYKNHPEQNWEIYCAGQRSKVPTAIREALMRDFQNYIRLRLKKNIHALGFDDFVEMAKAININ
jgi:hypothetical protein